MCGIAGVVNLTSALAPDERRVAAMIAMLRHRGPESAAVYLDPDGRAGLGHVRLSIIDLAGGLQPLTNEGGTLWVVVNGEFFNYIELADELRAAAAAVPEVLRVTTEGAYPVRVTATTQPVA